MKKILSFAILALSLGLLNNDVDESVFIDHPAMVHQYQGLDDSPTEVSDIFDEESESDSESDQGFDLKSGLKSSDGGYSQFFTLLLNSEKSFISKSPLLPVGQIDHLDSPQFQKVLAFKGASRAPPVHT